MTKECRKPNDEREGAETSQLVGDAIMAESFRIIDAEAGAHRFSTREWPIVRRMIHASGDVSLADDVHFHSDPIAAGLRAIARRAPIVTDVTMVLAGINQTVAAKMQIPLYCFLNTRGAAEAAEQLKLTRCAYGFEQAIAQLPGAVYVVGNAPTALQALCAAIRERRVRPALVLAMPVGFVAVAQSKEEALALDAPVLTIRGRKGGSAVAAAAVNALLQLALEESKPC